MGGLKGKNCDDVETMKVNTEPNVDDGDVSSNANTSDAGLNKTKEEEKTSVSPIPNLDGVIVDSNGDDANINRETEQSDKMDFKDDLHDLHDEFEEVQDELESEQVNDDLEGDRMSSSPLKDAFELVDEFSDSIDDTGESTALQNGDISDPNLEESETEKDVEEVSEVEGDDQTPGENSVNINPLELGGSPGSDIQEVTSVGQTEEEDCLVQPEVFENCENESAVDDSANLEEEQEDVAEDPLMEDGDASKAAMETKPGKRKNIDDSPEETSVRKSSRLRTKAETVLSSPESPRDTPKKQKMLQRPEERPSQVEEENFDQGESDSEAGAVSGDGGEGDRVSGDPSREPGADAERRIDQDHLMPFRNGWWREVVVRATKNGPPQVDVFYWPPKHGTDYGSRNREARRKRRSKVDQERFFEEFPHHLLSVNNFSYVRRALGLNNDAYEIIRHAKPGLETRSDKHRRASKKVTTYKEVAEHEGLLSSSNSDTESEAGIEEITEFDIGLPLSLQLTSKSTPLREEHKKRRKWPDRERCVTPPLACDMPWTLLDDDPLGVYTELHEELLTRSSPPTPPPLRAVRLTSHQTVTSISDKLTKIRHDLPDPLDRITTGNKDLEGAENLASHDLAVRKYKNYRLPGASHSTTGSQAWRPPGSSSQVVAAAPKRPQQQFSQRVGGGAPPVRAAPPSPVQGFVKVRLPMPSTNGKRPVVELVMLTNGKYQPIKFTNNRQVTESIPKRLFDQANLMKKTLYQRSVQVPKIGTKQVFLAINPTPGGVRPFTNSPAKPPIAQMAPVRPLVRPPGQRLPVQRPSLGRPPVAPPPTSDQVSILVRPASGGNAVLLNVPRSVALKVKVGTTLSFSASNDQKYTVIDNKMHPPVGRQKAPAPAPSPRLPSLPSGVSIRPVASGTTANKRMVATGRPFGQHGGNVAAAAVRPRSVAPKVPQAPQQSKASRLDLMNFTPCSPFCPGVSGIPELECIECHSLFHPKCVSIPTWQVPAIQNKFKCRRCSASGGGTEVIDLD